MPISGQLGLAGVGKHSKSMEPVLSNHSPFKSIARTPWARTLPSSLECEIQET